MESAVAQGLAVVFSIGVRLLGKRNALSQVGYKKFRFPVDKEKNLCYNIPNTVEVHCAKSTADGIGSTARCLQKRGRCRRQTAVTSVLVWVNKIIPTVAFAESYLISNFDRNRNISLFAESARVSAFFILYMQIAERFSEFYEKDHF